MNELTVPIPSDLNRMLRDAAELQGVSVTQYVLYVLTRDTVSILNDPISARVKGKDEDEIIARFADVLDRIPDREPPIWDQMEA